MTLWSDSERGFTLVELMVVVLIIGILVAIAIPVFSNATATAKKKSCFANQRTIEGMAQVWWGSSDTAHDDIVGIVSGANPLCTQFKYPPTCPVAPAPADKTSPTEAEGAYVIDTTGTVVEGCPFGTPVHGHYAG